MAESIFLQTSGLTASASPFPRWAESEKQHIMMENPEKMA